MGFINQQTSLVGHHPVPQAFNLIPIVGSVGSHTPPTVEGRECTESDMEQRQGCNAYVFSLENAILWAKNQELTEKTCDYRPRKQVYVQEREVKTIENQS